MGVPSRTHRKGPPLGIDDRLRGNWWPDRPSSCDRKGSRRRVARCAFHWPTAATDRPEQPAQRHRFPSPLAHPMSQPRPPGRGRCRASATPACPPPSRRCWRRARRYTTSTSASHTATNATNNTNPPPPSRTTAATHGSAPAATAAGAPGQRSVGAGNQPANADHPQLSKMRKCRKRSEERRLPTVRCQPSIPLGDGRGRRGSG